MNNRVEKHLKIKFGTKLQKISFLKWSKNMYEKGSSPLI